MEATFKGATPLNLSKPVYEVVQIGPPSSFITPRKMRADKEGCNLSRKIVMRFKRIKNLKGIVSRDWEGLQMILLDRLEVFNIFRVRVFFVFVYVFI